MVVGVCGLYYYLSLGCVGDGFVVYGVVDYGG